MDPDLRRDDNLRIWKTTMLGKIILSTLFAGLLAGFVMAGIQHVRLTPLILAAEVFESPETEAIAEATKPCVETMSGMKMCAAVGHEHNPDAWQPEDGWQRTLSTTVASLLTGAGFAVLLAGISLLTNMPITKQNGLIWGLCGFLAVAVAPAAGLSPELPGMPAGDLHSRQLWWLATIAATSVAIYLLAIRPEIWTKILGLALIVAPHIIGAPEAAKTTSAVPATLAAEFASNSLAAAALFWCVLGYLLGHMLDRHQKDIAAL